MSDDDLPTFDGPQFAHWLRKWKDAEDLEWAVIAERAGLSKGALQQLARGTPSGKDRRRGQTAINPAVSTLARLAHGLGLEFSYVASKGGLTREGDRWSNFSAREKAKIQRALRNYSSDGLDSDPSVLRLLGELSTDVDTEQEVQVNGE